MAFKPPGGEITFWSALWILFGIGSCILGAATGITAYYVMGAVVGLPAVGMWFDLRWCGYLFAILLVISIPLAIIFLFTLDDTLTERSIRLFRIGAAGYFAFISYQLAQDG